MINDFVHLNVHSNYSRGFGVNSITEICQRAKELSFTQLALTDRNGLYGMMTFLTECSHFHIQPIIGCELTDDVSRVVVWVKNKTGFQNLCRIVSAKHCHQRFSLSQILLQHYDGLIIASDHFPLLNKLNSKVLDLYVEVSPGYKLSDCIRFSKENNLDCVATNRVCFLEKPEFELHKLLKAIDDGEKLSRVRKDSIAKPHNILLSSQEMAGHFPHIPKALENTKKIADKCKKKWDYKNTIFPKSIDHQQSSKKLYSLSLKGCFKKYGSVSDKVLQRLEYEMDIVEKKGFADYFLVVHDICKQSSLTCGRGSSAASLISYALEITHVDPIRHNLFFERFLNLSRKDPPDIDIDFAWDERDSILEYVFKKYQNHRVAMVGNHVTLKERSSLREVAKVFGYSDTQISKLIKKAPRFLLQEKSKKKLQTYLELRSQGVPEKWELVEKYAKKIRGHFRYLSIHCGGIVIVPDEIQSHVPIEIPPKGLPTMQWDKDGVECAGLVKIDLLGNRSLAVIRDSLKMIEKFQKEKINYSLLNPICDEETLKLFHSGMTMGVFYFESPATRILLEKVGRSFDYSTYKNKDHFDINTLVTSIIRPASNTYIKDWVERLRGKIWKHLHPRLQGALKETLGIMVYQEQMSLAAIHLASFTAAEGDELRKIVSKKDKTRKLTNFKKKFVEGAIKNNISTTIIEKVWEMILSFDGYSFCKPHSASYTMVAYKSAWIKSHYPAEFMASVLSNQGGFYSSFAYISECKRLGLSILYPHINKSTYHYLGNGKSILLGFMVIVGLKKSTINNILSERKERGIFKTFENFLERLHLDRDQVVRLIKAGVFDYFGGASKRINMISQLYDQALEKTKDRNIEESLLIKSSRKEISFCPNPLNTKQLLDHELESFGFPISCHPIQLYNDEINKINGCIKAFQIHEFTTQNIKIIGWMITGKQVITKKYQMMEFISFEDQTGLFDCVLFPKTYESSFHLLNKEKPFLIQGIVQDDQGTFSIHVSKISVV